jgi:hypothetical protein
MAKGKKKKDTKARVNEQLEGFEVSVDKFGEIKSTLNIDRINDFLNKEVADKKLVDRDDLYSDEEKNEDTASDDRIDKEDS